MESWAQAHEHQVTGQARGPRRAQGSGSANGGAHGGPCSHAERVGVWRDRIRALRDGELAAKGDRVLDFLAWAAVEPDEAQVLTWLPEALALLDALGDETGQRLADADVYLAPLADYLADADDYLALLFGEFRAQAFR